MDCSPPGSSVHGISQARILEWVAIFFLTQGLNLCLLLSLTLPPPSLAAFLAFPYYHAHLAWCICTSSWWLSSRESTSNAEDAGNSGSIPGSGRPPGGGNGNPLQYSCLENSLSRGAWRTIVHETTKIQTCLNC